MIQHVKRLAKKKSVIGAFSVLAVTGTILGTQLSHSPEPTRYVLAAVTRGSLVTAISASGQVSAENQLDVTAEVSGRLVHTSVKLGEEVTADTPLFQIDSKTALKAVRDAQQNVRDADISLEAAQISYEKLIKPKTGSSLLQAQNALNQAERNLAKLQAGPDALEVMSAETKVRNAEKNAKLAADEKTPKTVRDAYDKTVISLKNLEVTLKNTLDDSDDILGIDGVSANINFAPLFSALDQSKKILANTSYTSAKAAIEAAKNAVDPLELRDEEPANIDAALKIVNTALEMTATHLETVKAALDASLTSSLFSQTSLEQYKSTIQSDITSVTNGYGTITERQDAVDSAYQTYENAQTSLTQAQAELAKLLAGPDASEITAARETVEERRQALTDASAGTEDIDVKTAQNTIAQRKSSLQNAKSNLQDAYDSLNDYTVRAPFDGILAKLDVKNAGQVSPSTVLATLLTKAKIAEVSLNEVDVSKIKLNQKATLTFDAVENLTIAGTVSEIDMIGIATQGVVTYKVKVVFLTEDERIKPGMSVSASIVTEMHADVLLVPNAAIHRSGTASSVDILEGASLNAEAMSTGVESAALPQAKTVVTGLSNDQYTEVKDGLKEGEIIVTRTIVPTTATAQTTSGTSAAGGALRIPGVGGGANIGGTGNFRTTR